MKQQHLKILRYNTGTDKKAFVQFKDFFDAAIFNATIVAYSGASVADLISMHSRRYIIDPQTHIFQQELSAYTTENKKTHIPAIKKSVTKYLEKMPAALADKILKLHQKPEPELIAQNLDALVECVYAFQTEFVNTFIVQKEYDKYLKFANMGPRPKLVIAPYFMIKSEDSYSEKQMWLYYNRVCLEKTIALNEQQKEEEIAAQLVLEKDVLSEEFIEMVASTYDFAGYEYIFIWLDDFNAFETKVMYNELFSKLLKALNNIGKKPIMAYAQMDKIRYSIMRLFIYYFSKSVLEHDFAHKDYQAFFGYLKKHRTIEPPTIITTNWDTLIESYCNKYSVDYSYGFLQPYTSDSIRHTAKNYDLLLLKIHGSANWLRCLNCGSISIFEKSHAATSLFEDNRTEKCPVCGHEKTAHGASMQPELITPTMMKSLSNQLYTNLWSSAAQELRDATHIIFVGYSLPIADFEFRYMLQKNVTSSAKIDVILTPNSNPDLVANNLKDLLPSKRYLDAFPKNKVSFYYEGFGPYFSLSK